jgi:hypothetical protein
VKFITADSPGIAGWKIPSGTRYRNGGSMTVDTYGSSNRPETLTMQQRLQSLHHRTPIIQESGTLFNTLGLVVGMNPRH